MFLLIRYLLWICFENLLLQLFLWVFCGLFHLLNLRWSFHQPFGQNFFQPFNYLNLVSRRLRVRSWKYIISILAFILHEFYNSVSNDLLAFVITIVMTKVTFKGFNNADWHFIHTLRIKHCHLSVGFAPKKRRLNCQNVRISCHLKHDSPRSCHLIPWNTKCAIRKVEFIIILTQ